MIFITLGSQKFQFNRLLKEIDNLIEKGKIKDEVFAQTGYSDYVPVNYTCKKFLSRDEFQNKMKNCTILLTHGGTGAITTGLKNKKKVVAVPRLSKFEEHVDNHQVEIVKNFSKLNLIEAVNENFDLEKSLHNVENNEFNEFSSNNEKFIFLLDNFLN